MSLYFITGNENKFSEASKIISSLKQLDIDLPEIQEVNSRKIIEAKLAEAQKNNQDEFIVEDTSLYFECLNSLPGPLIKWFLQELKPEGVHDLVKKYGNFNATAEAMIGYIDKNKKINFFSGEVKGNIVKPAGDTKFGWDPIFMPDGFSKTFAEMTKEEKNEISHRRKAFEGLKKYLEA